MPQLLHKNPVYEGYFADPFVWRVGDRYFAVGTGPVENSKTAFPLLTSSDLFAWEPVGAALIKPRHALNGEYWAPEVACHEGRFHLYYSVAVEELKHELRVAVSSTPEGPYEDAGALMRENRCPFAIDPHPFLDSDGQWYLFYARDFLDFNERDRAGTALVADRLEGMTRLAGDERTILRSRCDWQLFKARRLMYGKLFDWHTLEGPCVRLHEGTYYCFYSGGCFENETYGVDYATSSHVLGPYVEEGNETGPRVLKTLPGKLIGPGHHSIVEDPSGQSWIAYHAWDASMINRQMHISPFHWTDRGPVAELD